AARLTESIGGAVGSLKLPDHIRDSLPTQVTTIHKLLGSRSGTRHFIHTKRNKLNLDLLVVDEASMVDLEMMASLVAALPDKARVILLGDKDQLASVEAGLVLGDLCRNAEKTNYTRETRDWIEKYTGYSIPDPAESIIKNLESIQGDAKLITNNAESIPKHAGQEKCTVASVQNRMEGKPVDQHVVVLRKSHRFGETSGIGALARAVNEGDPDKTESVWKKGFKDIFSRSIKTTDDKAFASLVLDSGYRSYLKMVSDGPGMDSDCPVIVSDNHGMISDSDCPVMVSGCPDNSSKIKIKKADEDDQKEERWIRAVLNEFSRFQLLTPLRKGPWGVEGLNKKTAEILHRAGLIPATQGWYPGRPVMVLCNDYSLGLMNGDVGILLPVKGALRVVFPMPDRTFKKVLPSRLNDVQTVYAMTVHKSQGSEFDHTALVLPDTMSPVLTRELVYTGITRAKSSFTLVTPEINLLGEAVKCRTHRASGLGDMVHCL
ncbi:MAG: exodeoxyribonuclease V subunit alpha, partial [Desulfamplus sp.]|nr:exodeoxyribonuclease V subunit alpha [Desulfamplus sp.]